MVGFRIVLMAACIALGAGSAGAEGVRNSTFEPNSSMTFHKYLEPFPTLTSAQACRDRCVRDARCTGWTWYDDRPNHPELLRRVCVMGTGLKDSIIGRAPGRTAGLVTVR